MHSPEMKIAATAVRVPVFRSHAESIAIETQRPLKAEEARGILAAAPGVIVQDDPKQGVYPMPLFTSDHDEVYVGRIRQDLSSDHGLLLWAVADQIRKGAATNAIQIAEIVIAGNMML
jgi:aspartate-semialdehyde dehydrogenase